MDKNEVFGYVKRRQNYFLLCKRGLMRREAFTRYRNFVTSKIREAKKSYYEHKFFEYKNDIKKTWDLINKIVKPGHSNRAKMIKRIIVENVEYEDSLSIADKFNINFSNTGRDIAESVPLIGNHRWWLSGNHIDSFFFHPVSSRSISNILMSLKSKPCSIHSIPVSVYKY